MTLNELIEKTDLCAKTLNIAAVDERGQMHMVDASDVIILNPDTGIFNAEIALMSAGPNDICALILFKDFEKIIRFVNNSNCLMKGVA